MDNLATGEVKNPTGLCECGCGAPTSLMRSENARRLGYTMAVKNTNSIKTKASSAPGAGLRQIFESWKTTALTTGKLKP